MKKLLMITFIGLFNLSNHAINPAYHPDNSAYTNYTQFIPNGQTWDHGADQYLPWSSYWTNFVPTNEQNAYWSSYWTRFVPTHEQIADWSSRWKRFVPNGQTYNGAHYAPWSSIDNYNGIQGSGKTETIQLSIKGIKQISVHGTGHLFIEQCKDPHNCIETLTVTADDNILPYLKQNIHGDELTLRSENNVSFNAPIRYHATVKHLDSIESSGSVQVTCDAITSHQLTIVSSGSSNMNIQNIDTKKLIINGSGVSKLELAGKADEQTVSMLDASGYNAQYLKSNNAHITSSDISSIYLNVMNRIKGRAIEASSIIYNGRHNPEVNIQTSGIAKITRSSW